MRNRLLVFLAFLPFLGIGAQGTKEPKWYEAITVSGFVDVNYTHIDNNKEGKQEDTSSALHTYNKQFSVAAVELDVEKTADEKSPWGFRIDMMNGQNAAYQEGAFTGKNQMYNLNMLQQAYVSFYFPILKGVTVDVGKMATHIGTEVLESADNYNYTGGYIFFNTVPFIHTGARANLALTDDWSMGLYLYNSAAGTGYQDPATYLASNGEHAYVNSETARKAYGTQVKGNLVKDKVDIIWNTLYGSDVQAGRVSNQTQMANDYVGNTFIPNPRSKFGRDYWFVNHVLVSITPMDKLSIMLDWTFGEKSGSVAGNAKSGIAAPVGTSSVTIL
ncbi:MAG: porin, partial [Spirochaetia bacterium]|nr:porin [Spirochaetia bacterium]